MNPAPPDDFALPPFRPPVWARNPHVQTLGARVLRPTRGPGMRRERWELPDGDFLDVDVGPEPGPRAPVGLVLHGLEGSSRRRYVLSACARLHAGGVRPVALNFRGCSGEMNRLPRLYHSGETADPAWVLARIRERWPHRGVGALGFSLGGNVLLKLLGERADGGQGLVDAAVAISVPMDLAAGGRLLERTVMGRAYAGYFLRSLRRKVRAKAPLLAPRVDLDAALGARTLRAFDDAVTSRLHGFDDAADYYRRCSSAGFLAGIRVPTLVLHALDDPFLPPDALPRDALASNPALLAAIQPRGGHVGFLEGSLRAPRLWAEEEGARFLARRLAGG